MPPYAVSAVVAVIGETWVYYVVGSVVEVVLLLTVAAVAWTSPASGASRHATDEQGTLASLSS